MPTFTWIDDTEKQSRQVLEAIDLFLEKDTRGELGLAHRRHVLANVSGHRVAPDVAMGQ